MTNKHPERKIQHKIMNWCRDHGLKCYATANGQFLNSWSAIRERAGMRKGLPDLFIIIPANKSIHAQTIMVCMEVKSSVGKATKEQKEFMSLVNSIKGWVSGVVVHSLDEAIKYLQPMICTKPELTEAEIETLVHSL